MCLATNCVVIVHMVHCCCLHCPVHFMQVNKGVLPVSIPTSFPTQQRQGLLTTTPASFHELTLTQSSPDQAFDMYPSKEWEAW